MLGSVTQPLQTEQDVKLHDPREWLGWTTRGAMLRVPWA